MGETQKIWQIRERVRKEKHGQNKQTNKNKIKKIQKPKAKNRTKTITMKTWTKRNSSSFAMGFNSFLRMYCLDCLELLSGLIYFFFFLCVQLGTGLTDVFYRYH